MISKIKSFQNAFTTLRLRSGFTIVELLVVIVVIGILASITIVSYTGVAQKAKIAAIQSDLSNATGQLKLFQVSNASGDYPTTINCGIADSATNKCVKSSVGSTFVYTPNNATNPKGFTLTETNGSLIYKSTNNTSPTGPWVAGVAATDLAGKWVYYDNLPGTYQYKTSDTPVSNPQGVTGLVAGYPTMYSLVNPKNNPSVDFSEYPAQNACIAVGGRLPTMLEATAMYNGRSVYGGDFSPTVSWTSAESVTDSDAALGFGNTDYPFPLQGPKTMLGNVRCVVD